MTALREQAASLAEEWEALLAAARRLADNVEEPAAGPRYASEFGLALLGLAGAPEIAPDERHLLYIRAELWLMKPRRPARDLLRRLDWELGTIRRFAHVTGGTRSNLGRLQAALEG